MLLEQLLELVLLFLLFTIVLFKNLHLAGREKATGKRGAKGSPVNCTLGRRPGKLNANILFKSARAAELPPNLGALVEHKRRHITQFFGYRPLRGYKERLPQLTKVQ